MCKGLFLKTLVILTLCEFCTSDSSSSNEEDSSEDEAECPATKNPIEKWLHRKPNGYYKEYEVHFQYGDNIYLKIVQTNVPKDFKKFRILRITKYKGRKENTEDFDGYHTFKYCKPTLKYCIYSKNIKYHIAHQAHLLGISTKKNEEYKPMYIIVHPDPHLIAPLNAETNNVIHNVTYTVDWKSGCDYIHIEALPQTIMNTGTEIVYLGQVYEQSCDENGKYNKEIKHSINKDIVWSWRDQRNKATPPIKYRFTVEKFDDRSRLNCLASVGKSTKLLVDKTLEVYPNEQLSPPDSEYKFKNKEEFPFSCQPRGHSSTVKWIIIDNNNVVKNISTIKDNKGIERNFKLTNEEFDGSKLVCLQYTCLYSTTASYLNTLECTREVRHVITFRHFEESKPIDTTVRNVTEPQINNVAKTDKSRDPPVTPSGTPADTTEKFSNQDTEDQSSSSLILTIVGVIVTIMLVLSTLIYWKVKNRKKIEESPQEELIYASSEIQYAELELTQRTNTEPANREEVLYSKITGVLIPRLNVKIT